MFSDAGGSVPFTVPIAANQDIDLESVTARWNGASASGTFLACLAQYSQSGVLLSRTFPSQTFAAGDSGVVTYGPFLAPGDDGGGGGGVTEAEDWPSPVTFPIFTNTAGNYPGSGWTVVTVDATVRYGAVRDNSLSLAVGDRLSFMAPIGPQGSIWGVGLSYKGLVSGAQIRYRLGGPIASPNPGRGGVDDAGTLDEDNPTMIALGQTVDTSLVAGDADWNGPVAAYRIMGAPGDPFTAVTAGGDPYTGDDEIDGGPGYYRHELRVTAAGAGGGGLAAKVTSFVIWRLNDFNNY